MQYTSVYGLGSRRVLPDPADVLQTARNCIRIVDVLLFHPCHLLNERAEFFCRHMRANRSNAFGDILDEFAQRFVTL